MFQAPTYVGYVQTGHNAPTLFFDTGFLVQANPDPALRGWHAYRHPYQVGANIGADVATGIAGLANFTAMWDGLFRTVSNTMIRVNCDRARGHVQPAGNTCHVLFDTPDVEVVGQATIYGFGGPLMRVGDPGFDAHFNAAYAANALGPLNGAGLPAHHPVIAAQVGIVGIA